MKAFSIFITFLFFFNFSFISNLLASENNNTSLKEISINDFYNENFIIGNAEDKTAGTFKFNQN